MSINFYNPYQFIPVDTTKAQLSKWQWNREPADRTQMEDSERNPYVRHDQWADDGISATINCKIITRSSLVIGKNQIAGTDQQVAMVENYTDKQGKPAIPGNSLRGMIASIAETISQSSLRVIHTEKDSHFSVRKLAPPRGTALKHIGLLKKEKDGYYIYALSESESDSKRVKHSDYPANPATYQQQDNPYYHYANTINSYAKNISITSNATKHRGVLYLRGGIGSFPNKKHDTFLVCNNVEEGIKYKVPDHLLFQFNKILKQRHDDKPEENYLPIAYKRDWQADEITKSGDLLYFDHNKKEVIDLSYSAIWRRNAGNFYTSLKQNAKKNSLPWNPNRNQMTPAECMFGVVEEETSEAQNKTSRNLASRIYFNDAVAEQGVCFSENSITLKKLDSPKPPSPAMYFRDKTGRCVNKTQLQTDKHVFNGRKHYLPHQPHAQNNVNRPIWESADQFPASRNEKKKWKQHLQVKLIPENSQFNFSIHLENLSKAEFGLLLTALEPAQNNADFVHRLGLGKPYGLGQIQLDIKSIQQINRKQRYSLQGLKNSRDQRYENWKQNKDESYIDNATLQTLQTLANPEHSKEHPVCYPFTTAQDEYNEENGYEWFVNNDKNRNPQCLKPILAGKKLPPLSSN